MSKSLDPKLDIVFKLMFTRAGSESMLLSLLNAVLQPSQPIVSVTILNPELDKSEVTDRGVVLDLRLRQLDGSQINLEMQMGPRPGMRRRVLYHWARMYSSQLGDCLQTLPSCSCSCSCSGPNRVLGTTAGDGHARVGTRMAGVRLGSCRFHATNSSTGRMAGWRNWNEQATRI